MLTDSYLFFVLGLASAVIFSYRLHIVECEFDFAGFSRNGHRHVRADPLCAFPSPVYEFIVGREIVMRRRVDDWLNATQFLKVANFDKPQRTRILEREVQKGTHEKIQGGYGKSQGTWVPFERGVALAKQYNIEHLIRPLLEIDASHGSPPPAPKHVTAPPTKKAKKMSEGGMGAAGMGTASGRVGTLGTGRGRGGAGAGAGAGGAKSGQNSSRATPMAAVAGGPQGAGMVQSQQHGYMQPGGPGSMPGGNSGNAGGGYGGLAPAVDIGMSSSPYNMQPVMPQAARTSSSRAYNSINAHGDDYTQNNNNKGARGPDGSFEDDASSVVPSDASSSSRTPSPIQQQQPQFAGALDGHIVDPMGGGLGGMYTPTDGDTSVGSIGFGGYPNHLKRKAEEGYDAGPSSSRAKMDASMAMTSSPLVNGGAIAGAGAGEYILTPPETYGNIILDYFITEKARIPDFLIDPPPDFDPNVTIDDDGHTALHWACAMGRLRVVKLLLTAGADIFKVNHAEQTALMRSVMFSNNYDVRKFPELYQLLHRSTLNIDKNNRTVFHHIADVALTKGKTHAARYYMETILHHLEDFPQELEDVINFQDEEGETALTLAARARSKRLVRALLDHGADPKIANRDNKTAEDYILEDERFRSSPTLNAKLTFAGDSAIAVSHKFAPQLYHSHAAQIAAGKATTDLTGMLDDLAQSFDSELQQKERDIVQAEGLLAALRAEIEEAKKILSELSNKTGSLDQEAAKEQALELELETTMNRRYRAGWEAWLASEQERQKRWEAQGRPDTEEFQDLKAQAEAVAANGTDEGTQMQALRSHIEQGKQDRLTRFKRYMSLQAEVSIHPNLSFFLGLLIWFVLADKGECLHPTGSHRRTHEQLSQAHRCCLQFHAARGGGFVPADGIGSECRVHIA